ncbi:MAG: ABC transporter ATP-binding protein, partial [Planctomycetota bacterium]
MIEVSDLEFAYPGQQFQLRVEQFSVAAGEQAALIGPSGSGKSTLLHLLAGIALPDKGKVIIGEQNLANLSRAARSNFRIANVGLVFQSFELLPYLSVLDNLLLPFRLSSKLSLSDSIRQRARELAEGLEIGDKLKRFPAQLSQGEQQRVAIGRALIVEPPLLLADEPTGNLDPKNKKRVLDLMLQNASQRGVTVVMVTHDHALLDHFETVYEVAPDKSRSWSEVNLRRSSSDSQVQ